MTRRAVVTVVLAVLGIAVAAGLAFAASQLTGQRIGLASEPPSVAVGLAPSRPVHSVATSTTTSRRVTASRTATARRHTPASSSSVTIVTTTAAPPPATTSVAPAAPTSVARPAPAVTSAAPATRTTTAAPAGTLSGFSGPGSSSGHHRDDGHRADD